MRNGVINKSKADLSYLKNCLLNRQDLIEPIKTWGFTDVIRSCVNNYHDLFLDYVRYYASLFTTGRERISTCKVIKRIFGLNMNDIKWMPDLKEFRKEFILIVDEEYFNQCWVFIGSNQKEMSLDNEVWVLYSLRGPGLNSTTFDFTKINCSTIRKEIMSYYKNYYLLNVTNFKMKNRGLSAITQSVNFITNRNNKIRFCSDIKVNDVVSLLHYLEYDAQSWSKKNYEPEYIRKIIQHCGQVLSYFIKLSDEGHPLYYPLPKDNPFDKVEFPNSHNMGRNTEIIPDIVFEQFENHEQELGRLHRLMSAVFKNTGMRMGDVIGLEEECVYFNKEYEVWVVRYKMQKNNLARRKKGQQEYNIVTIPEEVALSLLEQEQLTKDLRAKYKIKNIFISDTTKTGGPRHALVNGESFVRAINRLAKKYQIVNLDGKVWHFGSRQYRKKVAVDMIENNATPHELARQLGHNNTRTSKRFYAQVRKAKLADLNHKFFEKKFGLIMGEEALKTFSEEERKTLYVDFCLDNREVELGVCTKHFSAEPCGKRTGKSNCANCKNICTGPKYLAKWVLLRDSQRKTLDELTRIYKIEGIQDYTEYSEYKRELYWFNVYNDAVNKIIGWKESR